MSMIKENPRYSCALGGALSTVKAIHRFIPIIHCGPGCGMMLYNGQNFIAGYSGGGYIGGATIPSTNTYEKEIVFGAEKRLKQIISSTIEVVDGDLYFVLTGCTAEIIGDDIAAVISGYNEKNISVIHASTGGFSGTNYEGYNKVWGAIVGQLLEERPRNKKLVNLFGIVPAADVFWQGNIGEIARLLSGLGLEVNTFFTGRQDIGNVKDSSSAALNIVLSPWLAEEPLKIYEKKFGIPYLRYPGLPVGPTATENFLRLVSDKLKLNKKKLDKFLDTEKQYVYDFFDKSAMVVTGFGIQHSIAVVGDSSTAVGVTKFLAEDFSQIPVLVAITDEPPENAREEIRKVLSSMEYPNPPAVVFSSDQWTISLEIKKASATYVLGSSLDKEIAQELAIPQLSISFPVSDRLILDRSIAGFRGAVSLVEDFITPCVAAL